MAERLREDVAGVDRGHHDPREKRPKGNEVSVIAMVWGPNRQLLHHWIRMKDGEAPLGDEDRGHFFPYALR